MKKSAMIVCLLLAAAVFFTPVFISPREENQAVEKSLWELELQRIKELYQLTDLYGDQIWPGFDTRKVPIAVNYNGRQQVLINHPKPPKEFRVFKDVELEGQTIMIREGSTSYAKGGAGRMGRIRTSHVSVPGKGTSTEKYLTMLLHESFHVFQQHIRERAKGPISVPPFYDIQHAAFVGLENWILYTALQQKNKKTVDSLVKMFVAVRSERRKNLSEAQCRQEDNENFSEGTAFYAEVRLHQLLHQAGARQSPLVKLDPNYSGYSEAGKEYRNYLEGILPPKDRIVTLGHERYQNGMAQALLLDRIRPGWKKEMGGKGMTQFTLLKRQFPMEEEEKAALVAAAKEKFGYEKILAQQERLIRERISTAHKYLDATGRRYRIYFLENPGPFNWKPRFPIYELPGKYLTETQWEIAVPKGMKIDEEYMEVLVLKKGIQRLEKGDLLFEGGEVPLIYWTGLDYIEWIDPSPATDKSDMKIQALQQEKDIYTNLILTTCGFTLRVSRARIMWSDKIVEIHPVPEGTGGLAPKAPN